MNANEIVRALRNCGGGPEGMKITREAADLIESLQAEIKVTGETSDGYHTFNELYHHRAVLFSVICNNRPTQAWKSKLHHDGTMYDGMFIVGVNTPDGQATYHYDIDPYWNMFQVPELPNAPEWDGHTPAQAIERLSTLAQPENNPLTLDELRHVVRCRDCKYYWEYRTNKNKQIMRYCMRMAKNDMEYHVKPDDFCSYGEYKKVEDKPCG